MFQGKGLLSKDVLKLPSEAPPANLCDYYTSGGGEYESIESGSMPATLMLSQPTTSSAVEAHKEASGSATAAWVRAADMESIARRFTKLAWKGGADSLAAMQDIMTNMAQYTGGNDFVNVQNKNNQTVCQNYSCSELIIHKREIQTLNSCK